MILTDDIINELKESVMDIVEGCCITLKSLHHIINDYGTKESDAFISLKYLIVTLELLEEEDKVSYDEEKDLWCYKV